MISTSSFDGHVSVYSLMGSAPPQRRRRTSSNVCVMQRTVSFGVRHQLQSSLLSGAYVLVNGILHVCRYDCFTVVEKNVTIVVNVLLAGYPLGGKHQCV